ncbi:uncharacterized protein [Euwallacea fornicatus]|uniref:uncharacterized protein isoform X1 n=1 Tax=Euwallacea fornicatus TaxID=995702 RepID=UPI00338F6B66
MLAMEYGTIGMGVMQHHKYAYSTMSSETISESCGSRNNRIRTVRLVRPANGPLPPPGLSYRHGPSLGFSIRGGREHGTGIFVSHVEIGSEAHVQGLRVGDQIVRINGYTVDDAVHKEVLQLISNHTHLTLKVRGVGMIPVKDKKNDGLSWQIITDTGSPSRGSPQLSEKHSDVRITVMVAPKSKLGCGICKGPEWKPGIFVQFTKEGGIAREAGLRPGDQILHCNNVDFSDIPFNEAVSLMKACRQLNMVIRKGAGSELFPGESSGYNSSASSVTGDQSPSWSESKRLSIVTEENLDLGERLNHLDKFKNLANVKKWESWDDDQDDKPLFKPTIINLSANGTTIHNNGSEVPIVEEYACLNLRPINNKVPNEEISSTAVHQRETKTVLVEVHRTEEAAEAIRSENGHLKLMKSASGSSFCSLASKSSCTSNVTNTSLSSAIALEIQRRQKKIQQTSIDDQLQKKKILKSVDSDRQHQHSKLMDEFKKAHQKMFKSTEVDNVENSEKSINTSVAEQNEDRLNSTNKANELSQKLSERLSNLQNGISEESKRLIACRTNGLSPAPPPPPPPPQLAGNSCSPSSRSNTLKSINKSKQAPPVPVKYSVLSSQQPNKAFPQPPPCPTPDYDTVSLASTTSGCQNQNSAEMESLESFRINSPASVKPRPPSTYFQKRNLSATLSSQSGCSTIRRNRPVSITIGEYATARRAPGKLDFLQNNREQALGKEDNLGNRLASELTQTLNRSNLKKRTESMENLLGESQIKTQRNGAVRISLNNLSKAFAKSTSDLTDDHYETVSRVTININPPLKNGDTPSGILKHECASHKTLNAQKSITFGEMPTLTKNKPLSKTGLIANN